MCQMKNKDAMEIKQNIIAELTAIRRQLIQLLYQLIRQHQALRINCMIIKHDVPHCSCNECVIKKVFRNCYEQALSFYNFLSYTVRQVEKPLLLKILFKITKQFSKELAKTNSLL